MLYTNKKPLFHAVITKNINKESPLYNMGDDDSFSFIKLTLIMLYSKDSKKIYIYTYNIPKHLVYNNINSKIGINIRYGVLFFQFSINSFVSSIIVLFLFIIESYMYTGSMSMIINFIILLYRKKNFNKNKIGISIIINQYLIMYICVII